MYLHDMTSTASSLETPHNYFALPLTCTKFTHVFSLQDMNLTGTQQNYQTERKNWRAENQQQKNDASQKPNTF